MQPLYRTGDQALVRQINSSLVMHVLRSQGPISRAALSHVTGLTKSTISAVVADLLARQFLSEAGAQAASAGRPGTLLKLNPAAGCIVSCEIGVDFIQILLTDFAPTVQAEVRERLAPDADPAYVVGRVQALLGQAIADGRAAGYTLLGVAVGVPGIVEHNSGAVLFAPNLGWRDVPLKALLEQAHFGAPIFVDNEANMATLGEHYFGAAQDCDEVLYISAGVGLGGGIIREGRLLRGFSGAAAEFGHMTIVPEGERCNCGNHGCWETLVSQPALFRAIGRRIAPGAAGQWSSSLESDLEQLTVPRVADAARRGDPAAREALDEVGHWLGIGIASLLNALNPERVVFGGILSLVADLLLPVVNQEIEKRALLWNRAQVQVVQAAHGSDACVLGGVATVYQYLLAQPDLQPLRNGGDA